MLIRYLESIPGKHITVQDICDYFTGQGITIGQATVYRHLSTLIEQNLVRKYTIDEKSPACFEYVGGDNSCFEVCLHCKCDSCGKLIHLNCNHLSHIQTHLFEDHNFVLNKGKTVFYGICENCQLVDSPTHKEK